MEKNPQSLYLYFYIIYFYAFTFSKLLYLPPQILALKISSNFPTGWVCLRVQEPLYILTNRKSSCSVATYSHVYRTNRVRMVKDRVHVQKGSLLQNQLLSFPTIVPVVEGVPAQHPRHSCSVPKVSAALRENVI